MNIDIETTSNVSLSYETTVFSEEPTVVATIPLVTLDHTFGVNRQINLVLETRSEVILKTVVVTDGPIKIKGSGMASGQFQVGVYQIMCSEIK